MNRSSGPASASSEFTEAQAAVAHSVNPKDEPAAAKLDRALAAIHADDDPGQLGPLLEQYRPYLLAIAQTDLSPHLRGKVGASDIVQETLALGYEHFDTFQGTSAEQLARWLRRILLNHLANVAKTYAAECRDVAREQSIGHRLPTPEARDPTASREAISREEWESLNGALSRLPEESQRVILLRHRDNRSFQEIAELLNHSEATTRRLWTRAIRQLQRELPLDQNQCTLRRPAPR